MFVPPAGAGSGYLEGKTRKISNTDSLQQKTKREAPADERGPERGHESQTGRRAKFHSSSWLGSKPPWGYTHYPGASRRSWAMPLVHVKLENGLRPGICHNISLIRQRPEPTVDSIFSFFPFFSPTTTGRMPRCSFRTDQGSSLPTLESISRAGRSEHTQVPLMAPSCCRC